MFNTLDEGHETMQGSCVINKRMNLLSLNPLRANLSLAKMTICVGYQL